MPKAKSKAQAGLFGAIAAGKSTKATGMSKAAAKRHVKGVKVKSLPKRRGAKGKKR
jgi:hypothetical protein